MLVCGHLDMVTKEILKHIWCAQYSFRNTGTKASKLKQDLCQILIMSHTKQLYIYENV